jgi:CheY-like chemotaxis protein
LVIAMARILHVENEEFWRNLVEGQLQDHHVDSVESLNSAIGLLDTEPAYGVALVDLNLKTDDDGQGGELLDLLRLRYPSTKRIVITGSPPAGSVRKKIFDRYDVEELIIKRNLDIPDLRRTVEEALVSGPGELSQSLRLNRSALRQRFRDWQRIHTNHLREEKRVAQEHLYDAGKVSGPTRLRAQTAADEAKVREVQFRELSRRLRKIVAEINNEDDLNTALEALEEAEEQFGDDADRDAC